MEIPQHAFSLGHLFYFSQRPNILACSYTYQVKHVTTDFHNQGEEKNEVIVYLSSEVYVYLSSEVVKNVTHFNSAHIGLQQDLLKLETLPPAITSSVNPTTSARFAGVVESESTKDISTWEK